MTGPRRLEELLAERATQGLAAASARELEGLLAANPDVDGDGFDLAAAALDLAMTASVEPMPARVRRAVLERARGELSPESPLAPVADFAAARSRREPPAPADGRRWAPWLAAAAALVLAVAGWWPRSGGEDETGIAERPPLESLERAPDAVRWTWSGTEDPAVGKVGGEVVWSSAEQRGFMRIRGLAANNPEVEQYQLWIFDRAQDERYPVDGGVFDVADGEIAEDGEVLVPIDAKIAVAEPYLFAVTVEKPGGVVVSSRERIVLLAQA